MEEQLPAGKKLAFEEFKLYYESTEKVTDRRLAANRWNYSICVAILVGIAALAKQGLSTPSLLAVSVVVVVLLSLMAALFCSLWIGQIDDFKSLNNEKFLVLNDMAPHVAFSELETDPRISYSPFDREWKALDRAKKLSEQKDNRIVALKSSNLEYLIPKAFRVLFIVIILATIALAVRNWKTLIRTGALQVEIENVTNSKPSKQRLYVFPRDNAYWRRPTVQGEARTNSCSGWEACPQHFPVYSLTAPSFDIENTLADIDGAIFVLADLTMERPSCYYELGLAEAYGKATVLVAQSGTNIHQTLARRDAYFYRDLADYGKAVAAAIDTGLQLTDGRTKRCT